ncbi:hypothetical protein Pcinc_042596 [Petrolisthes cinctipes]|uniref:Major facilitator superfamily (MFS) profile domain-containing protein n=1 Tax=Petrolisthes cinctipes TaxID=88211 RepID=A0AAE1BHE7_PETCI|nr:hypothetical protein Pcinc_042596 [Petrolisthes cinctipes]
MYQVTLEPLILLYSTSYIIQLSVQQDFIFYRLCTQHYSEQVCTVNWQTGVEEEVRWVQKEAVQYVMIMSAITSLIATFTAQFLGAALDRYSQKTVMVMPFLGAVGLHVVCGVVAAVPFLPLSFLYLGATLAGLSGGYAVFKSSISSYAVRSVEESGRTSRLGVMEGMLLLGSALGPLLLQLCLALVTDISHQYLFLGSECVIVLATLYLILLLPDLPAPVRMPTKDTHTHTFSHTATSTTTSHAATSTTTSSPCCICSCSWLRETVREFTSALSVTFRKRSGGRRTAILLLLLADFFIAIVYAAEFDLLYLYMQDKLDFTLKDYSRYLVIKNLVNGASLLCVLPGLRKLLGLGDLPLGILGGLSRTAAFTMLALNRSPYLVFMVPVLDVFGQFLFVVLRSCLVSLVDPEEQGRQLTVTASLAQLSLLVGSLVFDNLYSALLNLHHSGFCFLMAAGFMVAATCILVFTHCHITQSNTEQETRPLCR